MTQISLLTNVFILEMYCSEKRQNIDMIITDLRLNVCFLIGVTMLNENRLYLC